ncbi:MAG: hypothetical protein HY898_09200 [Deltaproteobacteria bacterium]|nr:hypothetical protein [Deltaproteobacteria bacterium]
MARHKRRVVLVAAVALGTASGCGLIFNYSDYEDQPSSTGGGAGDASIDPAVGGGAGAGGTAATGGGGGSAGQSGQAGQGGSSGAAGQSGEGGASGFAGQGGTGGAAGQGGAGSAGAPGDGGDDAACTKGSCPDYQGCIEGKCQPVKRVFITSDSNGLQGNGVGGITSANETCLAYAVGVSLMPPGNFKAWVATSEGSPSQWTVNDPSVWYVLIDETPVAHGWAGLTSGTLLHPIDMAVNKSAWPNKCVWTGAKADGTPGSSDCTGFTTTSGNGTSGSSSAIDSTWSISIPFDTCANKCQLYCIEQ